MHWISQRFVFNAIQPASPALRDKPLHIISSLQINSPNISTIVVNEQQSSRSGKFFATIDISQNAHSLSAGQAPALEPQHPQIFAECNVCNCLQKRSGLYWQQFFQIKKKNWFVKQLGIIISQMCGFNFLCIRVRIDVSALIFFSRVSISHLITKLVNDIL